MGLGCPWFEMDSTSAPSLRGLKGLWRSQTLSVTTTKGKC